MYSKATKFFTSIFDPIVLKLSRKLSGVKKKMWAFFKFGSFTLDSLHVLFLFFQTKCLFSLFRDPGHNLIQNNKTGGINSPLSKPAVSKNLKEDKVVKEKDIEGKLRPGDMVGC